MTAPPLIGFIGQRGKGKTLNCVAFAVAIAEALDVPIYANMTINHKKVKSHKMDKEFLQNFFKQDADDTFKIPKNSIIIIDEMATFLDSYSSWASKKSRYFTLFVGQTRKKGLIMFYTQQTINRVPKTIRDLTEKLIFPDYVKEEDTLHYEVYDYDGEVMDNYKKLSITQASRFFKFYDTDEIIDVLED